MSTSLLGSTHGFRIAFSTSGESRKTLSVVTSRFTTSIVGLRGSELSLDSPGGSTLVMTTSLALSTVYTGGDKLVGS